MGSSSVVRLSHVIRGAVLGLLALTTMLLVREWLSVAPPGTSQGEVARVLYAPQGGNSPLVKVACS
jgi:hypothetical protein